MATISPEGALPPWWQENAAEATGIANGHSYRAGRAEQATLYPDLKALRPGTSDKKSALYGGSTITKPSGPYNA